MKCRYAKCKLGGEVEKENAIYDRKMYFHKECHEKNQSKERLRETLGKFAKSEINIAISRAIDDNNYPTGLVEYVARTKLSEFKNAYGLLYHLKIEQNYKDYQRMEKGRLSAEINQAVKSMDIESDAVDFNYKSKNSKLNIY